MGSRRTVALLVVASVLALGSSLWVIADGGSDAVGCEDFVLTAAVWRESSADGSEPTSRQRLADQIERCDAMAGWSADHVKRILGEPTLRYQRSWSYATGYDAELGDGRFLGIAFDERRRVDSVTHDH